VLPLIGKDTGMVEKARALYEELRRHRRRVRRRRRRSAAATAARTRSARPWALTIDEQTLEDDTVTLRDRDTLAQERIRSPAARRTSSELAPCACAP
jgi:glycyl-tRNA synthetase